MKPTVLCIFTYFLFTIFVYSETINYDAYHDPQTSFQTIKNTFLVDIATGKTIDINISKGIAFTTKTVREVFYQDTSLHVIEIKNDDFDGFLSLDDVLTNNSDPLPNEIIFTYNIINNFYWIPAYSLNIIKSANRNTIFFYEPGRPEYGYDASPMIWYEGNPNPMTIKISNIQFSYTYPLFGDNFLVKEVRLLKNHYSLILSANKVITPYGDIIDYIYKNNLPQMNTEKGIVLLLECTKNRMRIYNGETRRIIFDLIKVSSDFYEKYIEFIETNSVPPDLIIPPELLEGWPGDLQIAPPYGEKTEYMVSVNLYLRSSPDANSVIFRTLAQGEVIKVLEPGLSGTIDGIRAPWVWVETQDGVRGWCFSGYLEPVPEKPDTEPAGLEPVAADNQDTPLYAPEETAAEAVSKRGNPLFPAGAAVFALGVIRAVVVLRKKKRP